MEGSEREERNWARDARRGSLSYKGRLWFAWECMEALRIGCGGWCEVGFVGFVRPGLIVAGRGRACFGGRSERWRAREWHRVAGVLWRGGGMHDEEQVNVGAAGNV